MSSDILLQSIQQSIVNAIISSTTVCQTTISADQDIKIACRNDQLADYYESNPTCVSCVNDQLETMKNQFALQIADWNAYNPSTIRVNQNIDDSYNQFMNGLETCVDVCKMCKLEDASQESIIQIEAACQINNKEYVEIQNVITANLANASFVSNGDIDNIIQAISGGQDRTTMRTTLAQLVNTNLSVDVISGMLSYITSQQAMIVQAAGAISITGLQQQTIIGLGVEFLNDSKFTVDFTTTSEWKSITEYYSKNSTVDALGQAIIETVNGIASSADNVVNWVLYVVMGVAGVTLLLLAIFYGISYFGGKSK